MTGMSLLLLPLVLWSPQDDKLDDGLGEPSRSYPVFVRMTDQLFPQGGAYEAFCRENVDGRRSELRRRVRRLLERKARESWKKIAESVHRLAKDGEIRRVVRCWIVNGFFCDATGKACAELAKQDAVAFLYRQRVLMQNRPRPRRGNPVRRRELLQRAISLWHDDSEDALDPAGLEIPWNLQRIGAPEAWKVATGRGIVVALFDTGLVLTPPLTRALWKNPGEKLDGKDTDGNGYVDDLFGWDFNGDHNCSLGDDRGHGSMCAGIVAGRPFGERKIVTGIAPRARVLPLRGMGYLKAYEYALAMGVDIVSMSYMWVNQPLGHYRGLYRLAHEHLAAGGIVAVGGAGNFSRLPRYRQIALPKDVPCVIAAAGILESGRKAPASSEGPCIWQGVRFYDDYPESAPLPKPDVTGCFGGYPVWAPTGHLRRRWRVVADAGRGAGLVVGPRGNSFAGPHAAGVAALMLSANPELPAWRVKELMEETCKDIGTKGRDPVFGAGLLQAAAAVRAAQARAAGK